jgi:putative DNA primase/helicase
MSEDLGRNAGADDRARENDLDHLRIEPDAESDRRRSARLDVVDARPPEYSDEALALRFTAKHGATLQHVAARGKWFIWAGTHWQVDTTMRVFGYARAICRVASAEVPPDNPRLAATVASAKTVAAVVSLARADQRHAATVDQWDVDSWLLNTPGGTVDLRTGLLRPARPEDYLTKSTWVAPGGDCPLWRAKVLEICGGDAEFAGFLQRWFGYCLTGVTREEMLVFFVGEGGNGKGTVIETVMHVMGDYATAVPMSTLVQKKYNDHPTEIAKLHGARLAVASETSDGARIDASMVKRLTGGDMLTGRFMRADFFDFAPTHKLVISGNRPLILGRVDRAIERRWATAPFYQSFRPDKTLKERLRVEGGGILAWLIEGCVEWQRVGLAVPEVVRKATEQYVHDQDDITNFIDECCTVDPDARVKARWLYDAWKPWAESSGICCGTMRDFVGRLRGRFAYFTPKNVGFFRGIRLKVTGDERDEDESAPK